MTPLRIHYKIVDSFDSLCGHMTKAGWSCRTADARQVTCKVCLKALAKRENNK